jgi:tetratricopeptide (TPR) repeat protein
LLALALLPSLQIVPVMRWWSPHYVYLPAAFALMLAGEVVDRLGDRAALAARALAGALGLVTLLDARTYATDAALWSREVEKRPACREGQFYLGEVDREARRWDAAARRYEAALAPRPSILAYVDHGAALVNLGTVRLEQRRFGEAREVFRRALEGVKDETKRRAIVHDLAAAALSEGDAAEADRLLEPETARPDAMPASLVVRAMALERLERRDEAAKLMSRARAAE